MIVLVFSWSLASAQDYCTKKKIREFNSLYHPEKRYHRRPLPYYPVIIVVEEPRETDRERRSREWRERPFSRERYSEQVIINDDKNREQEK